MAFAGEELLVGTYDGLYRFRLSDAGNSGVENVSLDSFDFIRDGMLFGKYFEGDTAVYDMSSKETLDMCYVYTAYSGQTHLFCGSEVTSQMFANTEYSVFELKSGAFVLLYKYKAEGEADTQFSDDGEYLILNIKDNTDPTVRSAVVLQARTGEVLLKLPDCHVSIRNGIIYNISPDYVPLPLATSRMYSMDELMQISKEK